MPEKIITALFDSRDDAQGAQRRLSEAGIGQNQVQITSGESAGSSGSLGTTGDLATVLHDRFLPEEDRATFAEGLRRGAFLLTAHVTEDKADDAARILDDSDAVDLDERAEQWRSTGWTGGALANTGSGGSGQSMGQTSSFQSTGGSTSEPARGFTGSGDLSQRVGQTQSLNAGQEQSIPVVQEQLKVGKREVQHGGVRVRSFVVETPVHEEIQLREEHVSVERRPADQAVGQGLRAGDDLLQERSFEITETSEEAVVAKEARVVEEVVVRKDTEQRTQTIDDTVRRTQVEVEKLSGSDRNGN